MLGREEVQIGVEARRHRSPLRFLLQAVLQALQRRKIDGVEDCGKLSSSISSRLDPPRASHRAAQAPRVAGRATP